MPLFEYEILNFGEIFCKSIVPKILNLAISFVLYLILVLNSSDYYISFRIIQEYDIERLNG